VLGLGYQYDNVGNVTKLLDSRGGRELNISYDVLDRLDTFQPAPGNSMPSGDYDYDAHGNIRATGLCTVPITVSGSHPLREAP
jgi:hypothetical protein